MLKRIVCSIKFQISYAIVITIINMFALTLADPTQENISHIANVNNHPFFVILWASSFAIYLILYTPVIMKRIQYHSTSGKLLCFIACCMMIISILIPYHPDETPLLAKLHINLSMLATVLYVLVFLHILYKGYFYDTAYIQHILPFYLIIVSSCGLLFLLLGYVNTILEILFVITMSWYLIYASKYAS